MMHMSYWFGTNIADFLFKGFSITSTAGFISTCCGLVSLAVLLEAVKIGLLSARQQDASSITLPRDMPSEGSALLSNENNSNNRLLCRSNRCLSFFNQLILFLSRDILSYTLMLSIMTFNGYFTISVSLGAGIGFFFFGPNLMKIAIMRGRRRFKGQQSEERLEHRDNTDDNASLLEVGASVCALVCDVNMPAQSTSCNDSPSTSTLAVAQIHSSQEQHL